MYFLLKMWAFVPPLWAYVLVGFCPRGFCPRGFCPRGFCPTLGYYDAVKVGVLCVSSAFERSLT